MSVQELRDALFVIDAAARRLMRLHVDGAAKDDITRARKDLKDATDRVHDLNTEAIANRKGNRGI